LELVRKKRVVLGITGSISAYKVPELLRKLKKLGFEIFCALTEEAKNFVSELVLEVLSGNEVFTQEKKLLNRKISHTHLSEWGEIFLIAPASANTIAKISSGIADNPVTELALCFGKGIICPAMNHKMLENPITCENLEKLKKLGWEIVEPEEGELACGRGKGRLANLENIADVVYYWSFPKPLLNKKVVISAGATREYIDSVRFISNPSTGKMGHELARVFKALGAETVLITSSQTERVPYGVKEVRFETFEELKSAVLSEVKNADIFVSASAVGDFKPAKKIEGKIKRRERISLELVPTEDILKLVSEKFKNLFTVGFSLEEDWKEVKTSCVKKLKEKKVNMIVGNAIKSGAFGRGKTKVLITDSSLKEEVFEGTKEEVALKICERVCKIF